MKFRKLSFVLAFMLLATSAFCQSGPDSFLGMKLGGKYSEKAILNALMASGMDLKANPVVRDTLPSFGHLTYSVVGMSYVGPDSAEPVRTAVTLVMSPDFTFEAVILTPEGMEGSPLTFVAEDALPDLMHYANANVTAVEDSFFGLELGSDVSLVSLVRAVGDKGSYHSSHTEGKTRVHSFSGVTFADNEWDYALFSVTPAGKLVAFTVYDVCAGAIKGFHPARRMYFRLRNLYFQKFGFTVPVDEDDDEVPDEYVFSGRNGIDQILSFFNTKTENGKDAYCVQMEFVHDLLNRNL